jgi:hypothetical protein
MKKLLYWLLGALALLLFLWGVYAFLFGWVVPKMASATVPRKWNNLPLRQPRSIVRGYLGDPSVPGKDSLVDQWADGSKNKKYLLRIYYVGDSIAGGFSIHYQYNNFLGGRDYLIDSFSIR